MAISCPHIPAAAHAACGQTYQQCSFALQDDTSAESVAQNVLAVALALLLCAALANIMWKIVIVSWALVSAAVRYVAVALILVSIAVFLG